MAKHPYEVYKTYSKDQKESIIGMITSKNKDDFDLALALMNCETNYGRNYWRKVKVNTMLKRKLHELQKLTRKSG